MSLLEVVPVVGAPDETVRCERLFCKALLEEFESEPVLRPASSDADTAFRAASFTSGSVADAKLQINHPVKCLLYL